MRCGFSESYASGTSVTLTATPGVGQQFTGWTGCTAIVGFPNMCTVTMDQARSVTATFAAIIWPLSVSVTGTGTVTSSPSGINCGADCSETYNDGTSVTLTATPGVGQGFTGWGGACSGTSTTCTLSMTAARSVSATFAPLPTYQLDVAVTGSGSVTSSPSGINCGADCLETYVAGTVVTLSQTPASGFEFAGWSGACTGTGPCSVTMDAAKSVTATFTPIQRTLTTNVVGSGSVTSSPAGVDCGLDCSQDYDDGTVVTLSQTPGSGYEFAGWSGDCTGTGACSVTMDQARSVTATFTPIQRTLTASVVGSGSVTSSPVGIDCGVDCSQDYDDGTAVTLSQTPASGFEFAGWSGDCTGTGACSVTMDQARSVTATFTPIQRTLIASVVGSGSVTSSPVGIDCGLDCSQDYDDGTVVTLSQAPASGWEFAGWSGDCTGTGACSVTMDAAKSVTATFTPIQRTLSVNVVGSGSVTSTPAGVDCGVDCSEDYDDGTVVTLSQTPASGFEFAGWSGDCTGTGACSVTMDAREVRDCNLHADSADADDERPGERLCDFESRGNRLWFGLFAGLRRRHRGHADRLAGCRLAVRGLERRMLRPRFVHGDDGSGAVGHGDVRSASADHVAAHGECQRWRLRHFGACRDRLRS